MIEKKIGELLIEQKLISSEQLSEAIDLQKVFPDISFGQLLCKLGYLKEIDLNHVLDQKNKRSKLVEVLLKLKFINQKKITHAIEVSRQSNVSIKETLLKLKYVDEEQLVRAVAEQYGLPYVLINSSILDSSLSQHISALYALKHRIAPVSKVGNTLTLAMVEPLKSQVLLGLEDSIRLRILPTIASETSIYSALKLLYDIDAAASASAENDEPAFDMASDDIDNLLSESSSQEEPEIEEEARKVTERDNVIVKLVNKIVCDAYLSKASDIHIEPYPGRKNLIVRTRIDGQCNIYQHIPYKFKFAIPSRIKIMAELDIAERRKPQDGKITFKKFGPLDIELRVATIPTVGGLEDVVIRLLPNGEPIPFENLGLTARNLRVFDEAINKPYGLVLVVGPTGSGKTTTLHSGLARINQSNRKIWTAEDPVEITQHGLRQVQVNPRIGVTFASALRAFLRADPDVIMVGEMRDVETASMGIEASLTGHLVFSTLHTNSAPETVTRLLEMGLDPFSFSDSLLCVLAQRLVRLLCNECKEPFHPDEDELNEIVEEYGHDSLTADALRRTGVTMFRAVGCENCVQSGYRGRVGIHEVLECTAKIRSLIKHRADTDVVREQALLDGMLTLKQDGILKVLSGLTDIHEVRRVCIK